MGAVFMCLCTHCLKLMQRCKETNQSLMCPQSRPEFTCYPEDWCKFRHQSCSLNNPAEVQALIVPPHTIA